MDYFYRAINIREVYKPIPTNVGRLSLQFELHEDTCNVSWVLPKHLGSLNHYKKYVTVARFIKSELKATTRELKPISNRYGFRTLAGVKYYVKVEIKDHNGSIIAEGQGECESGNPQAKRRPFSAIEINVSDGFNPPKPKNKRLTLPPTRNRIISSKDEVRRNAVQMLTEMLQLDGLANSNLDASALTKCLKSIAARIEGKLFQIHSDDKYKAAVRSKVYNLKTNPVLRKKVASRVIAPEIFAQMTTKEMGMLEEKEISDGKKRKMDSSTFSYFRCIECDENDKHMMTRFLYCHKCGCHWNDSDRRIEI
ncbi:transcription factor s-II (TFIIS), central domain-containing protein [Ditylenchus destructor]|nr:transcription factor s-II (TFIIS), central domain-containing protein [Ditylenchus destructor]